MAAYIDAQNTYQYDEEQPVLENATYGPLGPSLYEYKNRPRRDTWAAVTYLAFMFLGFVGAIVSFAKTDGNMFAGKYSTAFYQNSTSCSLSQWTASNADVNKSAELSESNIITLSWTILWLSVSFVVATGLSVLLLHLFRKYPVKMIYISVLAGICISIAFAIFAFTTGAWALAIVQLFSAVTLLAAFFFMRSELALCGQLFGVAGRGLQACPGTIISSIGVKVAGIFLLTFYVMAIICAAFVGAPEPYSLVEHVIITGGTGSDVGVCYSKYGYPVNCCEFLASGWAIGYCIFAALVLLWTVQVLLTVKQYIIADTLSQWYFAGAVEQNSLAETQPSSLRALHHAMTSSFGSICFAALILAVIELLRSALRLSNRNASGIAAAICCIIKCFADCILNLVEQFTVFATIAVAISGKGFIPAAMELFAILERNFLQTTTLWWIPGFCLKMLSLLLSLAWASVVYAISLASERSGGDMTMALISFGAMLFVLHFVSSILLDGVNTIYICYAFDRDRKVISHSEIHQVYEAVPSLKGSLIQQPDGQVAYAVPVTHSTA
ncbi:hypothetical protein CEUSTIGMA_g9614.t1 [Chlamydomonas eustigma]|uniref:Choline transporter-like protein n=1 Tax=Chlamydomonas eustigma TaxID=1157962 RepID=A0A250XGN2_9CHLO|nr:hypothetical protein CEUSTIGMA_g9614.t1 [Chlamydomonas eustigma]|eukprot:GAX82186.1 hypothetical protein CEUSTIGMA_g9614.t1 [Chlamydomonas eustigma]